MGDLRFTVAQTEDYDPRVWETAYITGIEGIPWQCHHALTANQFSIGRQIDESGKLNIVWPSASLGNVCLSTTSLRVTDEPYSLVVELARGTVSRLKTQTAEWQRIGLRLPDSFFPIAEDALQRFLQALILPPDSEPQRENAQQAIDLALQASQVLCDTYSQQALEARRQTEGRLSTLLGLDLTNSARPAEFSTWAEPAINLISIAADLGAVESSSGSPLFEPIDAHVEWAIAQQKKICMGPLVNFRRGRLPRWMVLLEDDFDNILRAACHHARTTLDRYRGKVQIWNCAAGLNVPNELDWSDEQVLRLAVSLIETVRRADDRSPVLLTIDRPWSEYLRDDADGISPLHFADALIRADLGLSGLGLDLHLDDWPDGSFPRDLMEISRMIDRWSMLGLPLMVQLNAPTSADSGDAQRRISQWQMSIDSQGLVPPQSIVHLLLSKPSVHAITWTASKVDTSYRELYTAQGQATPLLQCLTRLRADYLH